MATRQWSVTANGSFEFNTPANWAFGVVPGGLEIAQFNTGSIDTVTGNATVAEILVAHGTYSLAGTYTISGVQASELSVSVVSQLTIQQGALINGNQAFR
jgi:hypothetical protein